MDKLPWPRMHQLSVRFENTPTIQNNNYTEKSVWLSKYLLNIDFDFPASVDSHTLLVVNGTCAVVIFEMMELNFLILQFSCDL